MTQVATSQDAPGDRPRRTTARIQALALASAAAVMLALVPSIVTHLPGAFPADPPGGVARVRATEACGRLLDAIVTADMGGDREARQAARSALRASRCQLGRPFDRS